MRETIRPATANVTIGSTRTAAQSSADPTVPPHTSYAESASTAGPNAIIGNAATTAAAAGDGSPVKSFGFFSSSDSTLNRASRSTVHTTYSAATSQRSRGW